MVKPPLRTKSIGFKVSEEEYAQLETAAQASGWRNARKARRPEPAPAEPRERFTGGGWAAILCRRRICRATCRILTSFSMSSGLRGATGEMLILDECHCGPKLGNISVKQTHAQSTSREGWRCSGSRQGNHWKELDLNYQKARLRPAPEPTLSKSMGGQLSTGVMAVVPIVSDSDTA